MKNFFKILTLFFAFLVTNNLFSQLSKIHYIPPLTHERSGNNFDTNAPEDQWFYISTPSVSDVPFTIKRANGDIMYSAVVSNANPWIDRAAPSGVEYGYLFIFVAGFTPIPYKIAAITSGLVDISIVGFIFFSLISRGPRFIIEALLCKFLGKKAEKVIKDYTFLFTILLLILFILIIIYKEIL